MTTTQDKTTKTIKVVHGANATCEHAESPTYVTFVVNQEFLAKIWKIVEVCGEHCLTEARTAFCPAWGPQDIATELGLQDSEMVVTPYWSFWFTDYPKDGAYNIESQPIELSALQKAFDAAPDGAVVFLTNDHEARQQYAEDVAEEADGDANTESMSDTDATITH